MANITNAINMSFRVDKELKQKADKLFKELGLNTSVALNMFLAQCVRDQALPFTPNKATNETNEEIKNTSKEEIANAAKTNNFFEDIEDIL